MLRHFCVSNINIFNINRLLQKMPTLKALIIDDNTDFRTSCGELLQSDLEIQVSACDGGGAVESLESTSPDVVVMGLNIDEQQRWQLLKLIQLRWAQCQVLTLADNQSDIDAVKQIEACAVGFINSEDLERLLAKAVKKINQGEAWVPRKLVPSLVERLRVIA